MVLHYINNMFTVAGKVAEVISGKSWEESLRQDLLEVGKMIPWIWRDYITYHMCMHDSVTTAWTKKCLFSENNSNSNLYSCVYMYVYTTLFDILGVRNLKPRIAHAHLFLIHSYYVLGVGLLKEEYYEIIFYISAVLHSFLNAPCLCLVCIALSNHTLLHTFHKPNCSSSL